MAERKIPIPCAQADIRRLLKLLLILLNNASSRSGSTDAHHRSSELVAAKMTSKKSGSQEGKSWGGGKVVSIGRQRCHRSDAGGIEEGHSQAGDHKNLLALLYGTLPFTYHKSQQEKEECKSTRGTKRVNPVRSLPGKLHMVFHSLIAAAQQVSQGSCTERPYFVPEEMLQHPLPSDATSSLLRQAHLVLLVPTFRVPLVRDVQRMSD
ncbi:MAG: hypothetical protein FRX49_07729 [Trebouxia sp. A1-2]|nr:MAG: hypothetical protein FRX49_07729 [Trebouxia sp. A1-2]